MKKQEYLNSILYRRAIIPRYCIETINYLNIKNGNRLFNEVAILSKSVFVIFLFTNIADSFAVNGTGDVYKSLSEEERANLEKSNTHFSYYGEYAISFSKSGVKKTIFSRFTILMKIPNMQRVFLLYLVEFFKMIIFQKNILKT